MSSKGLLNFRQNEINIISDNLTTFHDDAANAIELVFNELRGMLGCEGVFKTEYTSDNIKTIIDLLDTDVYQVIKSCFKELEKEVGNMMQVIQTVDDQTGGAQ